MSSNRKGKHLSSNADKLRELLSSKEDSDQNRQSFEYIKSNYNFADAPNLEDLINIIKAVENVNQQLLIENKFLRDQLDQTKAGLFKLIEENSALHKELKNITVHDILNEFNTNEQQQPQFDDINNQQNDKLNKSKNDELYQNQLLINELQKKLSSEQSKNKSNKKSNGGGGIGDTMENVDTFLCTKCNEEMEIKIRQIENLTNEIEQLKKSKSYLKSKLNDFELKEADFEAQIKKYVDLVKHLELEKNKAIDEKEQTEAGKFDADKKLESILVEFNEKLMREKEQVISNVDGHIKTLLEQNQNLEERLFKQESLVDRLTRDKVSLISELESFKKKCNSIDFDTHQMAEKLRNKYTEVLKERDLALSESKRIRHDYELYVKQNDQDKFCLREELNNGRQRLIDIEKDLLNSREQCIQLTEEINKLQAEIIVVKHSKESVETHRVDNLKELSDKYEKRENQLVTAIEALQGRYCVTVKELEDLTEMQKKLINKLRDECKTLNDQLEVLIIKYRNDTHHLGNECDELNVRLKKYEKRLIDFEEQNVKHLNLHEKMKLRLKELTGKLQDQQDEKLKLQSSETLMKTTNIQLIAEINNLKSQLAVYTMPSRFKMNEMGGLTAPPNSLMGNTARDAANLNSVRSIIESTMNSIKN